MIDFAALTEKARARKTVCAFTGHRPNKLGGWDPNNPIMQKVVEETTWLIWDAFQAGYRTFISGFALGFDQEAAKLVLRLQHKFPEAGVRLIAAVPHADQCRPWPYEAQVAYRELLTRADEVHLVCSENVAFGNWMMQERNEWMVQRSRLLIAAWDGTKGGTANCVDYAILRGVQIWRVPCLVDRQAKRSNDEWII